MNYDCFQNSLDFLPPNRPKIDKEHDQITFKNQSPVLDAFWELLFEDFALFGEPLRGQLASIFRISKDGRAHFGLAWRASGVFELS